MSEVEFNRLLDAINESMELAPQERPALEADEAFFCRIPTAANDNGLAWPFIPFPQGWTASC